LGLCFVALALVVSEPASAQTGDLETALTPTPAIEPDLPTRAAPINLALTGAAVTGVWYGGALGASFIWHEQPFTPSLRIPIAGPWLAMTKDMECTTNPPDFECDTAFEVVRYVLLAVDGVGQATGLAFMLEALFMPSAPAAPPPREKSAHARLRPFPLVTGDAVGVGLAGEL
jgi:hypothetical protein